MDNNEAYVDAAARLLGLHIAATSRPGVLRFFALASDMAKLVEGLPLTAADEPGNVFVPVAPLGDRP
jgi:hypothetical protein